MKIYESKDEVLSFEHLLSEIMKKGDINSKNYEKLKEISEKLIKNDISPFECMTKYISETYKYLHCKNKLDEKQIEKLSQINKKVSDSIGKIEIELNKKLKKESKSKKAQTKGGVKIEEFRKKFELREEDADDNLIQEYLKLNKNDIAPDFCPCLSS